MRLMAGRRKARVIPFGVDLERFRYVERPSRPSFHTGADVDICHPHRQAVSLALRAPKPSP